MSWVLRRYWLEIKSLVRSSRESCFWICPNSFNKFLPWFKLGWACFYVLQPILAFPRMKILVMGVMVRGNICWVPGIVWRSLHTSSILILTNCWDRHNCYPHDAWGNWTSEATVISSRTSFWPPRPSLLHYTQKSTGEWTWGYLKSVKSFDTFLLILSKTPEQKMCAASQITHSNWGSGHIFINSAVWSPTLLKQPHSLLGARVSRKHTWGLRSGGSGVTQVKSWGWTLGCHMPHAKPSELINFAEPPFPYLKHRNNNKNNNA